MNSIYKSITESKNFFLIAGPCVVENREITFNVAEKVKEICLKFEIPFIFKASYKKANRSSIDSFSGIGDIQALEIIQEIKRTLSQIKFGKN